MEGDNFNFFKNMNQAKKFLRSKDDRIVFGICGGLSDYFNLNSFTVRSLFFLVIVSFGFPFFWYLILFLIISDDENNPKNDQIKAEIKDFLLNFDERIKKFTLDIKNRKVNLAKSIDWSLLIFILSILILLLRLMIFSEVTAISFLFFVFCLIAYLLFKKEKLNKNKA